MLSTRTTRRCLLALSACLVSTLASAQQPSTTITVTQPWSRATPGSAPVAGGYLTLANAGKDADRLLGGASDIAARVEVHEMAMANGVMTMRPVGGGLPIPPAGSVELKPGGFHLMFMGLKRGLKEGERFKATLQFEKAGALEVEFAVGSIGGTTAPAAGHSHGH